MHEPVNSEACERLHRVDVAGSALLEITRNGLAAIADEMAITHARSAYSIVAHDMLDFSTAVCDRLGRVIAQGVCHPIMLGAVPRLMRSVIARIQRMERGDVYFLNHPWQGGVHLPDICFVKPVFLDQEDVPAAFTVLISHMTDMGGPFPGSMSVSAASLWEEGVIIPLLPLVKSGILNQPLLDLIAANTRDPIAVRGDIRSALGALETGAVQYADFARRLGHEELVRQCDLLLSATERATRAAFLRNIPDGRATATDYLDGPGVDGKPPVIVCSVEKSGDRIRFDFTGTTAQLPAGYNGTMADLLSVCAFAAGSAMRDDHLVNDGFYGCVDFYAPEGCLINARFPAAVSMRGSSVGRVNDAAMAAMAQLIPGRLPAMVGGGAVLIFSCRGDDGLEWVFMDYVGGGWGGRPDEDGVPALAHPLVNSSNILAEHIEQRYPLRLNEYALVQDAFGVGAHLSAAGVVKEYEALTDNITGHVENQRAMYLAGGVEGGSCGTPSSTRILRAGTTEWRDVAPIGHFCLSKGDRIRVQLASGGGYGDPAARSPEAVARDLREERISIEFAQRHFGHFDDATAVASGQGVAGNG